MHIQVESQEGGWGQKGHGLKQYLKKTEDEFLQDG